MYVYSNITLREAAKRHNANNTFIKKRCNCTSYCTTKRCSCIANNIKCSTHCHGSRRCRNTGEGPLSSKYPADFSVDDVQRLDGNRWLSDRHMSYGSLLLKQVCPHLDGLNDTVLQPLNALSASGDRKYIQIFHVNGNHWLTASNLLTGDSCSVVDVYDSARVTLSTEAKKAIASFHQCTSSTLTLRFKDVQRQPNTYDCGVYALAFATSLAHGADPTQLNYCEPRRHIQQCFASGQLLPFPSVPRRPIADDVIEHLPLFCTCRTVDDGKPMIQCDTCDQWFHLSCALGEGVNAPPGEWHCDQCRSRS